MVYYLHLCVGGGEGMPCVCVRDGYVTIMILLVAFHVPGSFTFVEHRADNITCLCYTMMCPFTLTYPSRPLHTKGSNQHVGLCSIIRLVSGCSSQHVLRWRFLCLRRFVFVGETQQQ